MSKIKMKVRRTDATAFVVVDGQAESKIFTVDGWLSERSAGHAIRKQLGCDVIVSAVEHYHKTYEMDKATFIEHATPVEEQPEIPFED